MEWERLKGVRLDSRYPSTGLCAKMQKYMDSLTGSTNGADTPSLVKKLS